ncbi:MAG: hypothetical protein K0U66_04280 [Gammaproteobacteria bacterium]|nr:hypothetical protein [Gammaproteobacteria bacterium]
MGVTSWIIPNRHEFNPKDCHEGRLFMIDGTETCIHMTCIEGIWRAFIYPTTEIVGIGDTADEAIADLESLLGRGIFTRLT